MGSNLAFVKIHFFGFQTALPWASDYRTNVIKSRKFESLAPPELKKCKLPYFRTWSYFDFRTMNGLNADVRVCYAVRAMLLQLEC